MEIQKLEYQIKEFANKIDVPLDLLPQIDKSNDYAKPYIDIGGDCVFYYVISERGEEYERVLFRSENELFYRVFKDITFVMSQDYELKNRDNNQDFRIILFEKQKELMSLLQSDWGIRIKSENDKYL